MIRNRALERVVRELQRQRCDGAYIKYYLMEEYHVDDETAQSVMDTCGVTADGGPAKKKRGLYDRDDKGKGPDGNKDKKKDRFGSYFG